MVSIALRFEQRLGAEGGEPGTQECPNGRRITWRDLGKHQRTRFHEVESLADQAPAMTCAMSHVSEQLDRDLGPSHETVADRDEPVLVTEHAQIAPVLTCPDHTGVVLEVGSFRQPAPSPATGDENRILGSDPSSRAGKPQLQVGGRRAPEPVGAPSDDLVGVTIGEDIRVTGQLDDRSRAVGVERVHVDAPVDGRVDVGGRRCEYLEQRVHRARHYGRAMRVDVMAFPRRLTEMGDVARRTQAAGYDGILFTEGGRTAFPAAAATALAAPGLELSTGVAVAFPRSPMISAQLAWEIQEATGGHFRLGLGTQVRTHVERRFAAEFDHPGPRMRDYVLAVKACFAGFRGEPLDHHGDFYELTYLTPQWSPGPIDVPDPKVDIAAVNPWMLRMAGEVADGVHIHPIGEPGYLRRHALPNIAAGAEKAGRDVNDIALIVPVTTIVGDTDAEIAKARDTARLYLSFYGSTPNYAFIWDDAGFDGTTARIHAKQKAGDFAGMAEEITDDHLAVFCTESSWDGLADALIDSHGDLATRLALYSAAAAGPDEFERYGHVARTVSDRTSP